MANNVSAGKPKTAGGAIFRAPAGTEVPADASTALSEAFISLGLISEDGVTNATETSSEKIKAWGGVTAAVFQTEFDETYSWKMIEVDVPALKLAYGDDNVIVEGDKIHVKHNGNEREESVFVVETLLSGGRVSRVVIPRGQLEELGEVVRVDNEPIGYEVTISALVDDGGDTSHEYIAKIATA